MIPQNLKSQIQVNGMRCMENGQLMCTFVFFVGGFDKKKELDFTKRCATLRLLSLNADSYEGLVQPREC